MKKTLQDQYLLIKEGKGHKGVFLTEAKRQFPNIVRNAATFDEAIASLKTKSIISENIVGLNPVAGYEPRKKESYETAFESFLAEAKKKENEDEKVKAEEKKVSKPVEKDLSHNFDNTDEKNPDNMIFGQIMMGYYAEMKDPKNSEKTMEELKDMVFKNLAKDPIYYTKNAQFGIKDLGYTDEATALGIPKEPKGKYKSSGYGDLNEAFTPLRNQNNIESKLSENKLRKVIREIIDDELEEVRGGGNYGILTVNTSNDTPGERKAPKYYILSPAVRKQFNLMNPGSNAPTYNESLYIPHIRVTPDNTIFISSLLYTTLLGLEKGRGTREKQVKGNANPLNTVMDRITDPYWPTIRALLKKFADPKTTSIPVLGKDFPYHEIKFKSNGYEVEKLEIWIEKTLEEIEAKLIKASSGEKGRGRPINVNFLLNFKKQLEGMRPNAKGGMAIIPPPMFGNLETESLHESVEKDLADINKEAEHEVLKSKLDKIDILIDKRRSQLSKLDEDEDMKALTDKKKVKELEKDIKKLEIARNKVEKMMSKFKGKKHTSKEVIDETEEDLDISDEYIDDAEGRLKAGQDVDSIVDTYKNISLDQRGDLDDYLDEIAPKDQKSNRVY
jgi:hypothetical protein